MLIDDGGSVTKGGGAGAVYTDREVDAEELACKCLRVLGGKHPYCHLYVYHIVKCTKNCTVAAGPGLVISLSLHTRTRTYQQPNT